MFHESQFRRETYICFMNQEERFTDKEVFKLKRKWQIALRRYVLEQQPCPAYARYFGLPISLFREWIEAQFDSITNWDNFSDSWQFDHIVPLAYFNFKQEKDLQLCWNFTNIRIEKAHSKKNVDNRIDVIAAKAYFSDLLNSTGYDLCQEMIKKIESIEESQIASNGQLEGFIIKHIDTLTDLSRFTNEDYERVNLGMAIADILLEKKMLEKFGS